MIADLDRSIQKLLELEFGAPLPFDLSFEPPDTHFAPISSSRTTLDCFLFEIGEDRQLRRVEPIVTRLSDGTIEKQPPPARIRASYCITAWSPALSSTGGQPALDEHHLLSQVLAALLRHPTLPAPALFGSLLGQEPPLPAGIVQPDGVRTTSEFWTAVGGRLRAALDYSVTVSLAYLPAVIGPMVTTRTVRYGSLPDLARADEWFQIGGVVSADPLGAPIGQAWVRLVERGLLTTTDAEGRFSFERVLPGTYTLRAGAMGFQDGTRSVDVPEPTGDYTLRLLPI